jgi:hypothetical protein
MFTGRSCGGTAAISKPSITMLPLSGRSNPAIIRIKVVLPQPDGPSSEKNSPLRISTDTPSTATTPPKRLETSRIATKAESAGGGVVIAKV